MEKTVRAALRPSTKLNGMDNTTHTVDWALWRLEQEIWLELDGPGLVFNHHLSAGICSGEAHCCFGLCFSLGLECSPKDPYVKSPGSQLVVLLGSSRTFKRWGLPQQQWPVPIIITAKEAEIGRFSIPGQPGQKVCKTHSQ
jgi:hypothetical protein